MTGHLHLICDEKPKIFLLDFTQVWTTKFILVFVMTICFRISMALRHGCHKLAYLQSFCPTFFLFLQKWLVFTQTMNYLLVLLTVWIIYAVYVHINWVDFVYAPSQWGTTLQCNVVSHWLGAYTKWSLHQYKRRPCCPCSPDGLSLLTTHVCTSSLKASTTIKLTRLIASVTG